jgi:hypothetical protein
VADASTLQVSPDKLQAALVLFYSLLNEQQFRLFRRPGIHQAGAQRRPHRGRNSSPWIPTPSPTGASDCSIWITFSPDPDFQAKRLDIVGLYLNPPDHALVLSVDDKTGIQALDRIQPLLPLSTKKPRSWTNEYVRHGTQALLAALEIASGEVVAYIKQRRTSVNVLRFMNDVVGAFPKRELRDVLDNLNIHRTMQPSAG